MLDAWRNLTVPLRVAGDGPFFDRHQSNKYCDIKFLGLIDSELVAEEMKRAVFLVMPSECYEGFPIVLVEALSHGLPVIASRIGPMGEIIQDGVTGLHFEPGNAQDLRKKVQWMYNHPNECKQMGENAKKEYEKKFTPEKNYELLMTIYNSAIENHKKNINGQ